MHVAQILRTKGGTVTTVLPETTIAEAISTLAKRRIGAVLVTSEGGRVAGILSERDIVRGLAEHGGALLSMQTASLMTRAVVTCAPDNTIDEIMEEMTRRRFRHLPVLDGERLVGIISIGDVVKNRVEELAAEGDMLRSYIAGAA